MATGYLSHTMSTPTNRKKSTISAWVKKTSEGANSTIFGGGDAATDCAFLNFNTSDKLFLQSATSDSADWGITTDAVFRDYSAWYHVVAKIDTTQSTSSDRVKIYVNGNLQTVTGSYPSQNYDMQWSRDGEVQLVGKYPSTGIYFNGSMAHVHFTDGYAYDASTFGETDSTSGIWKPKTNPSVTYGTNGFFLKFENSGAMGTDSSGQSNTFTVGAGTITQNIDTPSNNFATLNGVYVGGGSSTLSNGNLTYTLSNYSYNTRSTLGFTKGKWYWEQKQSDNSTRIGLVTSQFTNDLDTDNVNAYYGNSGGGGVYLMNSASGTSWQITNNDTSRSVTTYSSAIGASAGDILMGAVDADAGKLWFGVNGTWMNSGNPAGGTNNQITFTNGSPDELQVYAGFGTSSSRTVNFNFGSGFFGTTAVASANADANGFGAFEYAVPSGFYSICTKNIKEFG
ncbi:hypothetical protein [Hyphomonas sp.]|uniref:hypothetical protein n=1 Tax=Hyphomonas sp. TaxID=87 RepID=UPI000C8AC7FF|nr:hypothetical protein [Hyphomonas sp.]MAL46662.1 hypothetical protein [Hyphomonas sp.]